MVDARPLAPDVADRVDRQVEEALAALLAALSDEEVRGSATRRARAIRAGRAAGAPFHELVTEEDRPLLVEVVSEHLDRVARAGAQLRRAEAAALHAEGMTMEAIAAAFGVSRQRVSAILKEARAGGLVTTEAAVTEGAATGAATTEAATTEGAVTEGALSPPVLH